MSEFSVPCSVLCLADVLSDCWRRLSCWEVVGGAPSPGTAVSGHQDLISPAGSLLSHGSSGV